MPICITTYHDLSSIKMLITRQGGPSHFDSIDFTNFNSKYEENQLSIIYPIQDGCGDLYPTKQYLKSGKLILKWRSLSKKEQQEISISDSSPPPNEEEYVPLSLPKSPTLPSNYIGTISNKLCHEHASTINLRSKLSITSSITLNPRQLSLMIPLHFLGATRYWRYLLHIIRYFYNELNNTQQLEEINKERHISASQRDQYNANINYLHNNRLLCDTTTLQGKYSRCFTCGFQLTPAIENHIKFQKLMNGHPMSTCAQCIQTRKSMQMKIYSNSLASNLLSQQINNPQNPNCSHLQRTVIIDVHNELKREVPIGWQEKYSNERLVFGLIKKEVRLRVITLLPTYSQAQHEDCRKHISGAELPKHLPEGRAIHNHPNLISAEYENCLEPSYDGVLVILKHYDEGKSDDYALLMHAEFNPTDLENYIREEDKVIRRCETHCRPGPASGRCLVSDPCKQLSQVTRNPGTLFYSSEDTAALKCIYENSETGRVHDVGRGSKETYSRVVTSADKKALCEQSETFRNIIAEQGRCCLTTLAVVSYLASVKDENGNKVYGIEPAIIEQRVEESDVTVKKPYLSLLDDVIKSHNVQESFDPWTAIAKFMSKFETTLNYSTNAAHVDKHGPEVLNIFHRHGAESDYAYLWLPQYNVVLTFLVDKTTSVGKLTETIHVADRGRDNVNFSSSLWVSLCER